MNRSIILFACSLLAFSSASAHGAGADLGGYFRVGARPDLQGGSSQLGYWNLYGRLLNEGPYAALELKLDILDQEPGSTDVWTSVHTKVEGGSVQGADPSNGALSQYRMSQVYALAGNVLFKNVTWQVGTLDTYFGTLGLYDMWPARLFYETVGLSARYQTPRVDLLLGLGDSGYYLKRDAYNTILTPGGSVRVRAGDHAELGLGGQAMYEPSVEGNLNGQYQTPDISFEDFIRGEAVERWVQRNPHRLDYFPDPESRTAFSYKAIGYLGFGGFGPVKWNNLFANFLKRHPEATATESYGGQDYTIYVTDFTDQRYEVNIGNELQLTVVPDKLDLAWGLVYGHYTDLDNDIKPTDYDRTFGSTVLRFQYYLTDTVHILTEGVAAQEISHNGNAWREHADSIFESTDGMPDAEGLEYGDADQRNTFQGKAGFVLNPLGRGVFTRPSLRLLYGFQYSNQNNAFGNNFVTTLDQFEAFKPVEQHWHHVLALETEVWF